jgi:hypothetical protein
MAPHPHIRRAGQAIAVALSGLALAASASSARPLDDGPIVRAPAARAQGPSTLYPAPGSSWGRSLRGEGAPGPAIRAAEPAGDAGFDWSAAAIGAASAAVLIVLVALATRRRPRIAA